MKLTPFQKRARREAREWGHKTMTAILFACHPVYEDDAQHYTNMAVMYARHAYRAAYTSLTDVSGKGTR